MKKTNHRDVAAMIGLLLLLSPLAAGQSSSQNAATWYQRALDAYQRVSEADTLLLNAYAAGQEPASDQVRAALMRAQGVLSNFRRGAGLEYADYGLDYSQGFELLLPHLGSMRAATRLVRAEAMMHLNDGNMAAAAASLGDVYRSSNHLGDDGIIISSLVGAAVFKHADEGVQIGIDRAAFGSEESLALYQSINSLPQTDPFRMVDAIAGEQQIAVSWMEQTWGNAEDRQGLDDYLKNVALGPDSPEFGFASMTDEEFAGEISQYDQLMDSIVTAFADPDRDAAKAELDRIEAEIEAGVHGALASVITPAPSTLLDRIIQTEEMVNQRRAMLKQLAEGAIKPEDEANAALYYLAAIEMIRELEPVEFRRVAELAADARTPMTEELQRTLIRLQETIDVLREGSTKRRCDFEFGRGSSSVHVAPDYIAGMRDVFRVLHADVIAQTAPLAAAERLATCYRICNHLGGEKSIAGALVTHEAFRRSTTLLTARLHLDTLPEKQTGAIRVAILAVSQRDPFGYIDSIMAGREQVRDGIMTLLGAAAPSMYEDLSEWMRQRSGDELLQLAAVIETIRSAGETPAQEGPTPHLNALADIFDLDELAAAQDTVSTIAPLIAKRDLDAITAVKAPAFARVMERMRHARRDLRNAMAMLPAADANDAE